MKEGGQKCPKICSLGLWMVPMIKINATRSEVIACIIKCINWMHIISFQIRRWIFQGKNVKRFGGWSKNDESSTKITVTRLFWRMCTNTVHKTHVFWGSYNMQCTTSFRVYKMRIWVRFRLFLLNFSAPVSQS